MPPPPPSKHRLQPSAYRGGAVVVSAGGVVMSTIGYGSTFDIYHRLGWPSVLPVPAYAKEPPPTGYTGHAGIDPSYADMCTWAQEHPGGNLALRLPDNVIGIDVDAYGKKTGAATLAEVEKRWGPLPPTYCSSSRTDGVSGIRLYRVPPGTVLRDGIRFPELGIGDIDIVQRHHRYVMSWPSLHPERRQYLWIREADGVVLDTPPGPADLPDLPQEWLEALRAKGEAPAPEPAGSPQDGGAPRRTSTRSADEVEGWCQAGIDAELDEAEADQPGTRNGELNSRALRCFRLALLVGFDLNDVQDAFVDACRANGLIDDDGIDSVRKTLNSARRKAVADGPCDPPDDNVTEVDELRTT